MKIQNQAAGRTVGTAHPFALERTDLGGFELGVAWRRAEAIGEIGVLPAHFGDLGLRRGASRAPHAAESVDKRALPAGHGKGSRKGPGISISDTRPLSSL